MSILRSSIQGYDLKQALVLPQPRPSRFSAAGSIQMILIKRSVYSGIDRYVMEGSMRAKSMIACLVLQGCLWTVTPTPARAADTIGERIATCSNGALEPLCLLALRDEAEIAVDEGDACIPQSVSIDVAAATVLAYLRDELRTHPERAGNKEEDEVIRAYAALWPCSKAP